MTDLHQTPTAALGATESRAVTGIDPARIHAGWIQLTWLFAIGCWLALPTASARWTSPRTIYVSPEGSDWNWGLTANHPVRSITAAARWAIPGDVMLLADGNYHERVVMSRGGTAAAPIIVTAEHPGAAVIDWTLPLSAALLGNWRDDGDGVYSCATRWPMYRIRDKDREVFRQVWGDEILFRKLVSRPGAMAAFLWRNGRLTMWSPDGNPPVTERMLCNDRTAGPREWGEFRCANLTIRGDHIQVQGLQCDGGIGTGISVCGDFVQIDNCAFHGALTGVSTEHASPEANSLTVKRCLYTHYPAHEWLRGWLSWSEMYAHHSRLSLVASRGCGINVIDSVCVHGGDGVSVSPVAGRAGPSLIAGNIFALCTDDAMELDGDGVDLLVQGNVVLDTQSQVAATPVRVGPTTIENNVCLNRRYDHPAVSIKLSFQGTLRNTLIRGNVFSSTFPEWHGGTEDIACRVESNVFASAQEFPGGWPAGVTLVNNHWPEGTRQESPSAIATAADTSQTEATAELQRTWRRIQALQLPCTQSAAATLARINAQRPGPSWWRWSHPATRELDELLRRLSVGAP